MSPAKRAKLIAALTEARQRLAQREELRQRILATFEFCDWYRDARYKHGPSTEWRIKKAEAYQAIGINPLAWTEAQEARDILLALGVVPVKDWLRRVDWFAGIKLKSPAQTV